MTDSLESVLREYMAASKNCFDGRQLLEIFESTLSKVINVQPKEEAAIAYFQGLVELRKYRLGDGDESKAMDHLREAAAKSSGVDDPQLRSIHALSTTLGHAVCGVASLRYAIPGRPLNERSKGSIDSALGTLIGEINGLTGSKFRNGEELVAQLLSNGVQPMDGILPEAFVFALTATGDFLSLTGKHHLASSVFTYIVMIQDKNYLAARLYQGRALWRHFEQDPSLDLAHQLCASYSAALKCISSIFPVFTLGDVGNIEKSVEDLDRLRSIARPVARRVTEAAPLTLIISQYHMAKRAAKYLSNAAEIVARAGAADILRYSGDRHPSNIVDDLLL